MKIYLILFCLVLTGCDQIGKGSANYQISSDATGNAWIVDTRTGDAKRCWQGIPTVSSPTCYQAVQK